MADKIKANCDCRKDAEKALKKFMQKKGKTTFMEITGGWMLGILLWNNGEFDCEGLEYDNGDLFFIDEKGNKKNSADFNDRSIRDVYDKMCELINK